MEVLNRLAKEKLNLFEDLAAYANMGDDPEDWKRFRRMCPDFFPITTGFKYAGFENLDNWMYAYAEEWHKDLAELPPEAMGRWVTPLLWYRNRLRSVWAGTDKHGYSLAILYGLEKEAQAIAAEHPTEMDFDRIVRPALIPGQPAAKEESHGLPPGKILIYGVTGEIGWKFGCEIQTAVYELMHERWRAKVCPMCGKYFVAMKSAQKLCSAACNGDSKRVRSLTYWNETGKKLRIQAKAK